MRGRITVLAITVAMVAVQAGAALACSPKGWLTIAPGSEAPGPVSVDGGGFPTGEVLIRYGLSTSPVIATATADATGHFTAELTLPATDGPRRIIAEPARQLDPGQRVMGWADLPEPAPPLGTPVPLTVGAATGLLLLLAGALWFMRRRPGAGQQDALEPMEPQPDPERELVSTG
jgi:hypothetical protein